MDYFSLARDLMHEQVKFYNSSAGIPCSLCGEWIFAQDDWVPPEPVISPFSGKFDFPIGVMHRECFDNQYFGNKK